MTDSPVYNGPIPRKVLVTKNPTREDLIAISVLFLLPSVCVARQLAIQCLPLGIIDLGANYAGGGGLSLVRVNRITRDVKHGAVQMKLGSLHLVPDSAVKNCG
jgi:hypothetical protein